jgi:pimeloyl-ACP methyl ester carboxylesterase
MPEKYLRRDGLPLLLRHTGKTTLPERPPEALPGPTVICLHDAGLQSSTLSDLLSSLASDDPNCTAVGFDLPGHGRSGGLDALASIEEMAETARWVARWCRVERPLLVGHGMGALVAIEWARSADTSVAGLVLCGIGRILGLDDDAIETMRRVTRGKAPRPFDPGRVHKDAGPELMKRAYMEGIATDPRATLGDLEASRNWCDAFAGGSSVDFPTLFVDGAAESDDNRNRSEKFAQTFADSPAASFEVVADASHYLPFEQPQALARQIRQMADTVAFA